MKITDKDNYFVFPTTISKWELCVRYRLSYVQLRATLPEEVKEAVCFKKKRKFGPKEASILFAYLDPDRYAVYLKSMGGKTFGINA